MAEPDLGRSLAERRPSFSGRRRSRRSRRGADGRAGRGAGGGADGEEAEPTEEPTEEPRVLGQPRLLGRREFVPYDGPRYAPTTPSWSSACTQWRATALNVAQYHDVKASAPRSGRKIVGVRLRRDLRRGPAPRAQVRRESVEALLIDVKVEESDS